MNSKAFLLLALVVFGAVVQVLADGDGGSSGGSDGGSGGGDGGGHDGGSGDGGGEDDDERNFYNRTVTIESHDNATIEFLSRRRSATGGERFEFRISTESDVEFDLKYYNTTDTTFDELHFRLRFEDLVEFTDQNGNVEFDSTDPNTLYALSDFTWNAVTYNQSTTSFDVFLSSTDGTLGFVIHLAGVVFETGTVSVRPSSLKIDVIINKQDKAPSNYLALLTRFASANGETHAFRNSSDEEDEGFVHDREHQVSLGNNGFFSWSTTATCNGQTINVLNSNLTIATTSNGDREKRDGGSGSGGSGDSGSGGSGDDGGSGGSGDGDGEDHATETQTLMVFTFNTTTIAPIVWDPKLGLSYMASSSASLVIPSLFALLLIFL